MMFVKKRNFEYAERQRDLEHDDLRKRYWDLREAHDRLLAHLGLEEVTMPKKTVLRAKGGPELGE